MFGAEAGANDAGDDDADLRGLLVEFAAGRKLCGTLEPDGVTDDGCAVRLLACGALERDGCAAGEKLGIDGEPD